MKKQVKYIALITVVCIFGLYSCDKTSNDPATDVREQYVGFWTSTESTSISYPVTISLDASNSAQILINNFHYLGASEKAYAIATKSSLTFPSQVICGNTISGSGTYVNANKITLKYYVNDQTTIDTVNATYTK